MNTPDLLKTLRDSYCASLIADPAMAKSCRLLTQKGVPGFFYKSFVFLPRGVLRMDTGGPLAYTRQRARQIGLHESMADGTWDELAANWYRYGISPRRQFEFNLMTAMGYPARFGNFEDKEVHNQKIKMEA